MINYLPFDIGKVNNNQTHVLLIMGDHRIYISRGSHVIVLDSETNKIIADIPDAPGVHGIALALELNRSFVSNGKTSAVSVFDLKNLK